MARATQQGSGYIIGMIVFGLLWATATVFLVVLYTDQEELRTAAEAAREARELAITAAEQRSIALAKEAKRGGPTIAGLLEEARSVTAEIAVGDPAADAGVVRQKRDDLVSRIKDQIVRMSTADPSLVAEAAKFDGASMIYATDGLFRLLQQEHDLRVEAQKRADDLNTRMDEAIAANTAQKADFDQRAAAMQAKLADIEQSRDQYRRERDAKIADLEKQYEELRNDCTATITAERQKKLDLEQRYGEMLARYTELQNKVGNLQVSPQQLATARNGDGVILTAVPGDDAVYIDLGRRDALILGMRFAVYSSKTGIPADGRAKASIRVESLSETSAECKVLWVAPHEVILEGDLVANPIYERDRSLTFVVVGDFDVDCDGQLDGDGPSRIEALVTNWGGRVVEDVTALTDFVVVGVPPTGPRLAGDVSPELQSRQEAVQRRLARYNAVVDSAKTLSIPMLPQQVFKNFLGYGPGGTVLTSR
ncbi:MAG: hypothetical protein C4547_00690 [Phycisphaerales bacterium]|nr:MAG: hypothetical protein C4547_00690 [Phycisphaerales bacterium]